MIHDIRTAREQAKADYGKRVRASVEMFRGLGRQPGIDVFSAEGDGLRDFIPKPHGNFGFAGSRRRGIHMVLKGLLLTNSGEAHGIIDAVVQQGDHAAEQALVVSRFPYDDRGRASVLGRITSEQSLTLEPPKEALEFAAKFANWATLLSTDDPDRGMYLEHFGDGATLVMVPSEASPMREGTIPAEFHRVWAPPLGQVIECVGSTAVGPARHSA